MTAHRMTASRTNSQTAPWRLLATLGASALLLTGCGSGSETVAAPPPSPSPVASSPPCPITATEVKAPAGSTTDLKTKPVIKGSTTAPPTDLQYADLVKGTGAEAVNGSQVDVKYVGVLYGSGKEFDSSWKRSADETLPFSICRSGVIDGFAVGPLGMKVGGRRQIIIPAAFGYKDAAQGADIPANSTLVFVVDLMKVTPPA